MEKRYPTWEVVGVLIGFAGSATQVPDLVNIFTNSYDDWETPSKLFKAVCISIYLLIIIVLSVRYLIHLNGSQKPDDDAITVTTLGKRSTYLTAFSESNWINFVRDFPLSIFRIFVAWLYDIKLFDIFTRKAEWGDRPDLFNQFLRAYFGNKTVEFQFKRNFKHVQVREALESDDGRFGVEVNLKWTELEFPFMTFTTWLGLSWTIIHLIVLLKKWISSMMHDAKSYFKR